MTWESSDPSIASVNSGGLVTGISIGNAIITVKTVDGNKTATCNVTVTAVTVAVISVSLDITSSTIDIDGTVQLNPAINPANATNTNVTWESSNPSIASVTSGGLVTGVSIGNTTITVKTVDGNKTAACRNGRNRARGLGSGFLHARGELILKGKQYACANGISHLWLRGHAYID